MLLMQGFVDAMEAVLIMIIFLEGIVRKWMLLIPSDTPLIFLLGKQMWALKLH